MIEIRNRAAEYIYNSQTIKNMLLKVDKEHREELKSYIIEMVLLNPEKLIKAYTDGYLDYWIWRIIENQYNSNTSPFRRKILNYKTTNIEFDVEQINDDTNKIKDNVLEKIEEKLRGMHWYEVTLFKMYWYENMTYKQIESETGINYLTIRKSVIKVLEKLKKNIKWE